MDTVFKTTFSLQLQKLIAHWLHIDFILDRSRIVDRQEMSDS